MGDKAHAIHQTRTPQQTFLAARPAHGVYLLRHRPVRFAHDGVCHLHLRWCAAGTSSVAFLRERPCSPQPARFRHLRAEKRRPASILLHPDSSVYPPGPGRLPEIYNARRRESGDVGIISFLLLFPFDCLSISTPHPSLPFALFSPPPPTPYH